MAGFRAGWLLAVLLLGGCAPARVLAPENTQGIRRVAVISAIGDKFSVRKIGFTIFGSDLKTFPIDAWGIDPFVVNKVRSVLAGRFDVRPFAYQREAFTTAGTFDKIADAVRAQAASTDIDAYIVVSKGSGRAANTKQNIYGLGILEEHTGLGPASWWVFALYWITVVDGHSFAVIASAPAIPLDQIKMLAQVKGPSRQVDESWMPTTLAAPQNMQLKSAITELLDRNLPGTIDSLKLLQ